MLAEYTCEEIAAALDDVAAATLDEAGVEGPPVNAVAVAARLGIWVGRDDRQQGRARYVRLGARQAVPPVAAILLRDEPRPERRQWAVAHEIGEHLAHEVFERLAIDPRVAGPNARERVANAMAGRLLVPACWLACENRCADGDLLLLKQVFSTASHELLARRLLEQPAPAILAIWDQGSLAWRAWNRGGRPPPPTAAEISCRARAFVSAESQEAWQGANRVRAWPVHEPGWQREIVRVELPEYEVDEA